MQCVYYTDVTEVWEPARQHRQAGPKTLSVMYSILRKSTFQVIKRVVVANFIRYVVLGE